MKIHQAKHLLPLAAITLALASPAAPLQANPDPHNWTMAPSVGMAAYRASSADLYQGNHSTYFCRNNGPGGQRRVYWPIDIPAGHVLASVTVAGKRANAAPPPTLRVQHSCAYLAPIWQTQTLATHVVNGTGDFRVLMDLGPDAIEADPDYCTQWLSVQFGNDSQSCGTLGQLGISTVLAGLRNPDQLFFSNFRDAHPDH